MGSPAHQSHRLASPLPRTLRHRSPTGPAPNQASGGPEEEADATAPPCACFFFSSSSWATSPVYSHRVPSASSLIIPAVSSGLFQYPSMTWGPEMASSPDWPGSTSFEGSSMSTSLQSVSGMGRPMKPSLRLPAMGLAWVIGEVSVSPYPSATFDPVIDSNFSATASGSAAAPDRQARIDVRS